MEKAYLTFLAEATSQQGFISSVLGGFSLSICAQLLQSTSDRRLQVSLTFGALLISGFLLISSTFLSAFSSIAIAKINTIRQASSLEALNRVEDWSTAFCVAGYMFLFIGLGSIGWIRSRNLGIISSVFASSLIIILTASLVFLGYSYR